MDHHHSHQACNSCCVQQGEVILKKKQLQSQQLFHLNQINLKSKKKKKKKAIYLFTKSVKQVQDWLMEGACLTSLCKKQWKLWGEKKEY